jgi:hypothetical protein
LVGCCWPGLLLLPPAQVQGAVVARLASLPALALAPSQLSPPPQEPHAPPHAPTTATQMGHPSILAHLLHPAAGLDGASASALLVALRGAAGSVPLATKLAHHANLHLGLRWGALQHHRPSPSPWPCSSSTFRIVHGKLWASLYSYIGMLSRPSSHSRSSPPSACMHDSPTHSAP